MPELPEVETIRLQLSRSIEGQTIQAVQAHHVKSLHGNQASLVNRKVAGVRRLGKMLVIELEGKMVVGIHFKMSGQLVYVRKDGQRLAGGHPTADWTAQLPSKHTRVTFRFTSGDSMYFNDQRLFGWVKILTQRQLQELPFVKSLGPEPWDISDQTFLERIHKKGKPIKVAIMDQDVISGVGNIYANDALWEAQIHPKQLAHQLKPAESKKLRMALVHVLKEGIKYGGATAGDQKYINLDGSGGRYQEHFRVYAREGKFCLRKDKGIIHKITLGGRGTYFCPVCQKL